ncbi:hypothetical protein GobsT_28220 [Gemmata obscuriglobus]|nr:hypothetical protein GobsT_28220 [Gemmata obscuriglobus]VTS05630.1 unnamed protein product [Gemmata obscuriglobus UQM 2246]
MLAGNKAAGSDFNRGPRAFTTPVEFVAFRRRRSIQAGSATNSTGETNNTPGNAIASSRTRGGTPQDV